MKKYICTICGYIYEEVLGVPEEDIVPGTRWENVPEDWVCPLCGAEKFDFKEEEADEEPQQSLEYISDEAHNKDMSSADLSALFSNLSKGCEKQYRIKESELFNQLSEYFSGRADIEEDKEFDDLGVMIKKDLDTGYPAANDSAKASADRGALRALVWSEKTTRILGSILQRYEKTQSSFFEKKNVFVCEICGFVYIGDEAPDLCPVCKVPNFKIEKIKRR